MFLLSRLVLLPIMATVLVSPNVNIDYEGSVSPYDGSPVEQEEITQVQFVKIPDGSTYDRNSHTFNYSVAGYDEPVISTVANGMIVTDSVSVTVPNDMEAVLYRDGEKLTGVDMAEIKDTGSYSLVAAGLESNKQVLSFDIVGSKTGKISSYTLPEGFTIQSVMIDGATQAPNYSRTVDLSKEGDYAITYRCTSTAVNYNLNVYIDHTPPEVEFEGLKGRVANGPVKITGMQDDYYVTVIFNNEEVKAPSNGELRTVGDYMVTVYDDAQNSVTKEFTIRMYLNMQGGIFVGLAIILIASAGTYMYVSRKRLRVR
ncbi:MAG: hypothetical protein E7272_03595 [Pseudobutyrivibrio ruminis]|uniref:Uncharacterized protein n=1 Tax=Pseudobutyrivibrio ruminis TaxID=46206 RepID=A0A927U886_9FIRM|nr:hypothetical protein [Pseudobutyrivibrio ruminis]